MYSLRGEKSGQDDVYPKSVEGVLSCDINYLRYQPIRHVNYVSNRMIITKTGELKNFHGKHGRDGPPQY